MPMLALVFTPTLTTSKDKPVAHVGHLLRPVPILLGLAFAATQTLDDLLDLQKLGFGILGIIGFWVVSRQTAVQASAQLGLKVAHLRIGGDLRFEHDKTPRVVVNLR